MGGWEKWGSQGDRERPPKTVLLSEESVVNQWYFVAISRYSKALRGTQRPSVVIRGTQRHSEALRRTQRHSDAIRRNHRHSAAYPCISLPQSSDRAVASLDGS
jgi:hypothetical protein